MSGTTIEELLNNQSRFNDPTERVRAINARNAQDMQSAANFDYGTTPNQVASLIDGIQEENSAKNELAILQESLANRPVDGNYSLPAETGLGNLSILDSINKGNGMNNGEFNYDKYQKQALHRESSGDYNVVNSLGYTGGYQYGKSTAEPYLKKLGTNWDKFKSTPAIQDEVFKLHTQDNIARLKKNNLPVTSLNLYALHQQGGAGGINLLKGGNKYAKNIANNIPKGQEATAANWLAYYAKDFM